MTRGEAAARRLAMTTVQEWLDRALDARDPAALNAALDGALAMPEGDEYQLRTLAGLLMESDRAADAVPVWRALLDGDPASPYIGKQWLVARGLAGDGGAADDLADLVRLDSADEAATLALVAARAAEGRLAEAWQLAEAGAQRFDSAAAWRMLARMRGQAGETEKAEAAYAKVRERGPELEGQVAAEMAALKGRAGQGHDAGFIRGLFDQYADRFDGHLTRTLHYRAPELLAAALAADACPSGRVLDLGCGTGLSGRVLKPYAAHLTGVDLSPAMLARAAETGLYDALHEAEIIDWMRRDPAEYDLICAVDTVVYLGDLHDFFSAASRRLSKFGRVALTAEDVEVDAPWHMKESRRFGHSQDHLRQAACAAGLAVASLSPIIPRSDRGQPISGWCLIAHR